MNDRYYFNTDRDPVKAHDDDYIYDNRLSSGIPSGICSWLTVMIVSVAGWFVSLLKLKS